MRFKKALSLAGYLLIFTVLVSTSRIPETIYDGSYLVSSDCTNPYTEEQVTLSSRSIVTPAGKTFNDYGLPTTTFGGYANYSGVINVETRSCDLLFHNESNDWAYSCKENGVRICSVVIQRQ